MNRSHDLVFSVFHGMPASVFSFKLGGNVVQQQHTRELVFKFDVQHVEAASVSRGCCKCSCESCECFML